MLVETFAASKRWCKIHFPELIMHDAKSEPATLSNTVSELGEGPSFEPETNTLWWFDILGKLLHERNLSTGEERHHPLPFMASVIARIDEERQLLATEEGLYIRNRRDGALSLYCELEAGNAGTRSNDGRLHPSGCLWIGTMGKGAEEGAGAIYHVARKTVTRLFSNISIPNGICFSPDGSTGYFVDTTKNLLMRVSLDSSTGLPVGEPTVLIDTSDQPGGMDGSVCDRDGNIWNARWGAGAVDCYSPDGTLVTRRTLPARQTTCPVFFGPGLTNIGVTSAWEGLSPDQRESDPLAGQMFAFTAGAAGTHEPSFRV
nr:SMP-30/gluconolactonase/LRE family protein [Pseudorhizobium flavum]